jgi:hypothetical protein
MSTLRQIEANYGINILDYSVPIWHTWDGVTSRSILLAERHRFDTLFSHGGALMQNKEEADMPTVG